MLLACSGVTLLSLRPFRSFADLTEIMGWALKCHQGLMAQVEGMVTSRPGRTSLGFEAAGAVNPGGGREAPAADDSASSCALLAAGARLGNAACCD